MLEIGQSNYVRVTGKTEQMLRLWKGRRFAFIITKTLNLIDISHRVFVLIVYSPVVILEPCSEETKTGKERYPAQVKISRFSANDA